MSSTRRKKVKEKVSTSQLPTRNDVLDYFEYRRNLMENRTQYPNHIVISCPRISCESGLKCDDLEVGCSASPFGDCIVKSVLKPWILAGYRNLVIKPLAIKNKRNEIKSQKVILSLVF